MPSTKAAGGGIYSGVFLKDIKVPDQSRSKGGAWRYLFFQQLCHSILMFILIRITCGFIIGSSSNLSTHFCQSLPTTIYMGWGLMVSGSFCSNITTGCSSSVARMMSWNSSIMIVLMRFHVLVWSSLDSMWMSKAFGWLIVFASNRIQDVCFQFYV